MAMGTKYFNRQKYLLEFLKEEETFEADFIAGEYKNKFYITQNNLDKIDPALMGLNRLLQIHSSNLN